MPWDLTYRPRTFDQVVGHDVTVKILRTRVRGRSALDQSYVFSGPHGSGKTTLARILASAALCEAPQDGNPCLTCTSCQEIFEGRSTSYEERDAASQGKVDDVRQVIRDLDYASVRGKVICWDEAHRMSNESQDALLKPVEEHRLICIFATTEPGKIRGAIRSRCDDFAINRVSIDAITERLQYVCEQEEVEFELGSLNLIARFTGGHVRDAIKRAEMISRLGPISVASVKECLRLDVQSVAYGVLLALVEADAPKAIEYLRAMMNRVSPAEAVRTLARASLQSYRRGNNFGDSIDPLDAELADRLFTRLGPSLPSVAAFLADRPGRLSQEAVECQVLSLLERMRLGIPFGAPVTIVGQTSTPQPEPPSVEMLTSLKQPPASTKPELGLAPAGTQSGVFTGKHPGRGPWVEAKEKPDPVLAVPIHRPDKVTTTDGLRSLLSQTLSK